MTFSARLILALALAAGCLWTPTAEAQTIVTVDLTLSQDPVADIITAVQTPTGDGVMVLPAPTQASYGFGAFAIVSTNHGAAAPITVSFDNGAATLPLFGCLCRTNPETGQCLAAPTQTVTLNYAGGAIETLSLFLQSTGPIIFEPA